MTRPPERPRRQGTTRLAPLIDRLTAPALRHRGLAAATVVQDWDRIVGPDLAAWTRPVRLTGAHDANGGALSVRVPSARALELQHRAEQIIERINGYYGFRAVARIKLLQGPVSRPAPPPPPRDPAREQARLAAVADMADGPLKDALADLARAVARRRPPRQG